MDKETDGDDDKQDEPVSSMPLVLLGAFILWLGFLAFNAGTVTAMIGAQVTTGKARLRTAIVGLLTANVAVTSLSTVLDPWAAVAVGVLAGVATVGCIPLWPRLPLDAPTEYLTLNLIGGLLGLLSAGVFVSPGIVAAYPTTPPLETVLLYGCGPAQLQSQLLTAGPSWGSCCRVRWARAGPYVRSDGSA